MSFTMVLSTHVEVIPSAVAVSESASQQMVKNFSVTVTFSTG